MKIAYIVPALANKGPVIVVKELVSEFVRNGHDCSVFYFDEKVHLDFDCPVFRINKKEKIDFNKFDVVHSHGLRPDLYIFNNKPKEKTKTHFISTMHNYVMLDLKCQYNSVVAFVFGYMWMYWLTRHDKIVTLSQDAQKYYNKWFSEDKLYYAYNTRNLDTSKKLNRDELALIMDFKADSILLGVNALLSPVKGIDLLINALPFLPQCKLFVVGDGQSRMMLQKLADRLGVSNRCCFVGFKADAYRYLEHYDIFALPSRSEGFPLSLLEASVYAIPVVASNIPIIKEAFSADEISFFDISNPFTIVDAVQVAINNKDLGINLNRKYLNSYSPSIMYERYLAIYNRKV